MKTNGIIPVLLVLLLAGCGPQEDVRNAAYSLKDDLGRTVAFETLPTRIVSLSPGFTEILYAIGADSILTGISSYCNYPPECASKPRVGSLLSPSIEAIVALNPDLVLVTVEGNTKSTFLQLEKLGVKTFAFHSNNLNSVLRSIKMLGALTGHALIATHLADSLATLQHTTPLTDQSPTVLMVLSAEPLIVAGNSTFLGEMIHIAGGRNVVEDATERYPVMSRERIITTNPDIILVPSDMHAGAKYLSTVFPEWKDISAFRNKGVHIIDGDVFMRPGPRLWQGLQQLRDIFAATPPHINTPVSPQ